METENLTANHVTIEPIDHRGTFMLKLKGYLRRDALLFLTVGGIIVGFAVGFGVRETHPSKDALMWLGMPGELFLRMLKMMILPLIVCSVISGTSSLDPKSNGKISAVAFAFVITTNTLSCVMGIILYVIIKPGADGVGADDSASREVMETQDVFADMLRNIMPDNIVEASFRQALTQYKSVVSEVKTNTTNGTIIETITSLSKSAGKTDGVNVIGLITACTVIGMAASSLKGRATVFLQFFTAATEIVLVILRKFFWLAPVGIGSLIAVSVAGVTDIEGVFSQLGMFVLAVTVGVILFTFGVLPALLFVLTRRNPYAFIFTIVRPCLIAFASTSTAVAIPEMLESCEKRNGIDPRVSRFVVPLSVTISANGSAIYITLAALFIAQFSGVTVTAGTIVLTGILASITAMAIPSVPSASIVTLVIILTSLNIPANHIALLFAVEWFLDRIRTVTNVVSHTYCAAVTYRFCKVNLKQLDHEEAEEKELTSLTQA